MKILTENCHSNNKKIRNWYTFVHVQLYTPSNAFHFCCRKQFERDKNNQSYEYSSTQSDILLRMKCYISDVIDFKKEPKFLFIFLFIIKFLFFVFWFFFFFYILISFILTSFIFWNCSCSFNVLNMWYSIFLHCITVCVSFLFFFGVVRNCFNCTKTTVISTTTIILGDRFDG